MLGGHILALRGNAYLIPLRLAYRVLEEVGTEEVDWDPTLLKIASEQAARRGEQLHAQLEVDFAIADADHELEGYPLLAKLDQHQKEAVAAICVPSLEGMAIFDEQGTGKTIMALAAFDRLRGMGSAKKLLVIAPKSVLGSWSAECAAFLGTKYLVTLVNGPTTARRKAIQSQHDILLISYDSTTGERGLIKAIVAAQPGSYMLVVDESYFVKNPNTLRAQAIAEIRPFCERAVVLCGTPAPNSPLDIVNQVSIADGGVAFGSISISSDPKEAERQIEATLGETIFLRRLKEDVFPNIPKKQIERVALELRPCQQRLYTQARDNLVLAVRSVDDREFARHLTSFLAKRAALLQICSHPGAIDPLYDEPPAKHLALDRLLKELIERDGKKVVVWSFFRHSLQALTERYAKYGVARIDGSVGSIEDRIEAIRRFQNDPEIRLFVGNAAAAGAGITLIAAHHAIYESFSNQAAHYMQSVDRIHRRGQRHDVTYYVLLTRGTIEEREFDRILEKERRGRDLLGDRYEEPMTRERFLTELEAGLE